MINISCFYNSVPTIYVNTCILLNYYDLNFLLVNKFLRHRSSFGLNVKIRFKSKVCCPAVQYHLLLDCESRYNVVQIPI